MMKREVTTTDELLGNAICALGLMVTITIATGLVITDRQLGWVQGPASLWSPSERDRFLPSLVNHVHHDHDGPVSDDAIGRAIPTILEGYGIATGAELLNKRAVDE
jgi:hypothetical protein